MMIMKESKFKVGDRVFHITEESDHGVVLDGRYSLLTGLWEYNVTFSPTQGEMWFYEHELSEHKIYNSYS